MPGNEHMGEHCITGSVEFSCELTVHLWGDCDAFHKQSFPAYDSNK